MNVLNGKKIRIICVFWGLFYLFAPAYVFGKVKHSSPIQSLIAVIAKEQKTVFQLVKSSGYTGKKNISYSYIKKAEDILLNKVSVLTDSIYRSAVSDIKVKIFLLNRVYNMLLSYKKLYHINMANILILSDLVKAFHTIIAYPENKINWDSLLRNNDIETNKILLDLFHYKISLKKYKNRIILHYIHKYPEQGLDLVHRYGTENFDTIFMFILHKSPQVIFKDLQSNKSKLLRWYLKNNNPYLKLLLKVTNLHKANLYFPFYEDLLTRKMNLVDIKNTVNYPSLYFSLLVKIHLRHQKKIATTNDTPMNYNILVDYMYKIADQYIITPINNLHYATDPVRYKRLINFNVYDLYYLVVSANDNLYTSSFLYIYKMFLKALNGRNGFIFLKEVYFDKYRKFLKTLATYSHLYGKHKIDFLNRMDARERIRLMRLFVNSIPVNTSIFLESAVDVASTLTEINAPSLERLLSTEIKMLYTKYVKEKNKRGELVYYILQKLLINTSVHTHILTDDSVSVKPENELYKNEDINTFDAHPFANTKNGLVEQLFFYGDEDSHNSFFHLLYTFSNKKNWRIINTPDWVVIRSVAGMPISIYANRPLKEINQGYLGTQIRLKNYFLKYNIIPSVVMHRGHSYFVTNTINNLSPHVKMVLLGSCGSYTMVSRILKLAPQVHLVTTRQIGKTTINSVLFYAINEELRTKGIIRWNDFWAKISDKFKTKKDKKYFDDYIPPNKNLGAIFIKYYYHLMSKLY